MVKKAIPKKTVKKAAPEKDVGGRPPRDPDTLRDERLVLRVHKDFLKTLSDRADEQRMNRSRYVEEVLRGWLALDPRNPKFDINGKIDPRAPTASQLQMRNPIHFMNQIAAGSALNAGFFPQAGAYVQPKDWVPPDDDK